MVKYIRLGKSTEHKDSTVGAADRQECRPSRWKQYAAGIASAITITAGVVEYNRNNDYWAPRVHTLLSINSPQSIEYRLDSIAEDLEEYPDLADRLIRDGIQAVHNSGNTFSTRTYLEMFGVMKDKLEQSPELLDYLGPVAIDYQESRIMREYKQKVKDTYREIKQKAIKTKDRITEMLAE